MICEVLQRFDPNHDVPWDVCYEWEEEIAKDLGVPLRKIILQSSGGQTKKPSAPRKPSVSSKIIKLIKKFPGVWRLAKYTAPLLHQNINEPLSLGFVMNIGAADFMTEANCLPIFMDFWSKANFASVMQQTKGFRIFYVTSREAYNRIKAIDSSSNVLYMPLSIADKYHSQNFVQYRHKTLDVIQIGRKNPVLHEYMLRYSTEHKGIDYVYRDDDEGEAGSLNIYASTTRGAIGRFQSREEFIQVLSSAKVSLVSSQGIDVPRKNSLGLNFVTPRFYESAILGCALLGRYPDNQEFRELNMSSYCPNITSYEHFCEALEHALAQTPEELYAQNRDFIINSLTSKRAQQIQRDLEAIA